MSFVCFFAFYYNNYYSFNVICLFQVNAWGTLSGYIGAVLGLVIVIVFCCVFTYLGGWRWCCFFFKCSANAFSFIPMPSRRKKKTKRYSSSDSESDTESSYYKRQKRVQKLKKKKKRNKNSFQTARFNV